MSRGSRVPRDAATSKEMRNFLDDIERQSSYVDRNGNADFTTLKEGGKRAFVQASSADEGGLEHTPKDHGDVSSGTITIDPQDRIHHVLVCKGDITISPASTTYHGSCLLHITNGTGAGTKTMSGFNIALTGTSFTNTEGDKFGVMMFFYGSHGVDYQITRRQ